MLQHKDELEGLQHLTQGVTQPLVLTITLRPDGLMAIQAPIADKAFCLRLLEEAKYAIQRQPEPDKIVVPGSDTDSRPKLAYGA